MADVDLLLSVFDFEACWKLRSAGLSLSWSPDVKGHLRPSWGPTHSEDACGLYVSYYVFSPTEPMIGRLYRPF
jgi:hypothetical protein